MRIISIIFTLILILIGVAFTLLNAKKVEINYLLGSTELPLAVILLISLILGSVIALLIMGIGLIKLKAQNTWLSSQLKRAESRFQN